MADSNQPPPRKRPSTNRRRGQHVRFFADEQNVAEFMEAMEVFGYIADAAEYVGVHRDVVYDEVKRNKDFAKKLAKVKRAVEYKLLKKIRNSKDWRSAAWELEKKNPKRYGNRPAQVGGKHVHLHGGASIQNGQNPPHPASLNGGTPAQLTDDRATQTTDMEDADYIEFVAARLAPHSQLPGGVGGPCVPGSVEVLPALGAPQPTGNGLGGGSAHNGHANGRNGHH